jgi:hypothetical protein
MQAMRIDMQEKDSCTVMMSIAHVLTEFRVLLLASTLRKAAWNNFYTFDEVNTAIRINNSDSYQSKAAPSCSG